PVPDRAPRPAELEESLPGQRLGQAEQAGLGRGVVDLADVAGLADGRGHVDDPAGTALDHVLDRGLGHEKAPDRLTAMTFCQSSSVILATVRSMAMPAL